MGMLHPFSESFVFRSKNHRRDLIHEILLG